MAGQITAIQAQTRNKKRANILIDGEFAFSLTLLRAAQLSRGQYLSDSDIADLRMADEQDRAYEMSLDFLSFRPRSQDEVTRWLERKEFAPSTIQFVIERLSLAGLLNDQDFAQVWVRNRQQFSPRGTLALRHELRQKGIADSLIDDTVQQLDQTDGAYRAATQQSRRWQHLEPADFRRKLYAFLQRRGFNYDVIEEVWQRMAAEQKQIEQREEEIWD